MKERLYNKLMKLEKSMLDPARRLHFDELTNLLADDFMEFGSSGLVYDKQQVIAAVKAQALDPGTALGEVTIEAFQVRRLAPDLALVTYIASTASVGDPATGRPRRRSLRSSIWRINGESAQIAFHQGTRLG